MKFNKIAIILLSSILVIIGLIFIVISAKQETKVLPIIKESTTKESKLPFKIEDRTDMCLQALELIFSDDEYDYYLSCIKSGSIYLIYEDGTEITLREAIDTNKVSIEELKESKIATYKQPKK